MNINNLKSIVDYLYEEEVKHLELCICEDEEDETKFNGLPENLEAAIYLIEKNYPRHTTHIGYHIMVLQKELNDYKAQNFIACDNQSAINSNGEIFEIEDIVTHEGVVNEDSTKQFGTIKKFYIVDNEVKVHTSQGIATLDFLIKV